MAPRFAPGEYAEAHDVDGNVLTVKVRNAWKFQVEGIVVGFPAGGWRVGDLIVRETGHFRAIETAPVYRHRDGLVAFGGAL